VLTLAIFEPPVSAWALADQIGSTYHWAPTNGLSTRTPGVTLATDELERELDETDDEGTELEVVGTLELLGRELEVVELLHTLKPSEQLTPKLLLDDLELEVTAADERELGMAELVVTTDERELELGAMLLDVSPTILGHVERAIQLLLLSQPQPLWVVTHKG